MNHEPNHQERRERAMLESLRALVRAQQQARFGRDDGLPAFELKLALRVDPKNNWELNPDQPIVEQISHQLAEQAARRSTIRLGHIYCYACQSNLCAHAQAPSSLDVFTGYTESGKPQWSQLVQNLLELGYENVHQLYAQAPAVQATWVPGDLLHRRMLVGFGRYSHSFVIHGQVVAGYFSVQDDQGHRERVALTLQWVEGRDTQAQSVHYLNTVVYPPLREAVIQQLGWIKDVCKYRAARLRKKGSSPEAELHKLAGDLLRGEKRSKRTTKHAHHRRPDRPVEKALADVHSANHEKVYYDAKTDAFAVRGKNGRCHIFSKEGKHVTSFSIDLDAIQSRLRRKRWRPIDAHQFQVLVAAIHHTITG